MGAKSSKNTTQNNRSEGHLLEYFRNTFVRGGGGTNTGFPYISGGNVANGLTPGNGYKYHTFTEPGTFTIYGYGSKSVEILIVGGGGAGGKSIAGGGGAGGVLQGSISLGDGNYQVSVGKGGWGGPHTNAGLGGSPTDFYLSGTSFPNPSSFARAYGGGGGNGYASNNRTPNNPSAAAPAPWMGGGSAGGSSGGAGNQYGTGGYPGYTSATITKSPDAPSVYVGSGYPSSPITPAPYTPHPANPLPASPTAYGSDAPVPGTPGVHPTYYDQGLFPTTYYMGLRGWGNNGGMCYGPALDQGGAGGGGAGGAGQDIGSAPATSGSTSSRGADGGIGKTFAGFTAPLFCDPSTPTGSTVKSTLDPLGGYFAGGGGGSNYNATQGGTYGGGRGGDGGGGAGAPNGAPGPGTTFPPSSFNHPPLGYDSPSTNGTNAVLYSGGGGGGAGYSYGDPGSGGPGIVIIRYLA